MSTEPEVSEELAEPREEKSRTPCIVLPIVGLFVLMLCYVTFVVVRNISPTSIREAEGRRATATAISSREADAGATVAAEMQAEATETAIVAPSPVPTAPGEAGTTPTPSAPAQPAPDATSGASP
ncbi:MAG: hypothetical protein ACJ78Q_00850 [Chloroflexia bacterium]